MGLNSTPRIIAGMPFLLQTIKIKGCDETMKMSDESLPKKIKEMEKANYAIQNYLGYELINFDSDIIEDLENETSEFRNYYLNWLVFKESVQVYENNKILRFK